MKYFSTTEINKGGLGQIVLSITYRHIKESV